MNATMREIALVARRVEGDEPRQQFDRACRSVLPWRLFSQTLVARQFMLRWVYGLSSEKAGIATSNIVPSSSDIW